MANVALLLLINVGACFVCLGLTGCAQHWQSRLHLRNAGLVCRGCTRAQVIKQRCQCRIVHIRERRHSPLAVLDPVRHVLGFQPVQNAHKRRKCRRRARAVHAMAHRALPLVKLGSRTRSRTRRNQAAEPGHLGFTHVEDGGGWI